MADIEFACEKCGQKMEIDRAHAGAEISCAKCGEPVAVPCEPPGGWPVKRPTAKPVLDFPEAYAKAEAARAFASIVVPESVIVKDVSISWGSALDLTWKFTICGTVIGLVVWVILNLIREVLS